MKRLGSEVVGGLFWLAVGIFFALGAIWLKPGTLRNPGPGFLPLMMASLLVCSSLTVLAKGLVVPTKRLKKIEWRGQSILVVSVFVYGVLLDLVGFLLSTFALMCVLFGLLFAGKNRWAKVACCAVATALVGWLVFAVALKVPFPQAGLMVVGR